jgi:predicted nucleic acid-binding protein
MTAYLLDTNILLRWQRTRDPLCHITQQAVRALLSRGEEVCITPQNLIEFWNVATRPESANGFGMTPGEADQEIGQIEIIFLLLPDTPDIYDKWRRLVVSVGVSGVQVHDARLVAVMQAHGLTHLLTFNTDDFIRYPGIEVVHPRDLVIAPL